MKALVTAKIPEEQKSDLYKVADEISYAGRGFDGYMLDKAGLIKALGDAEMIIDGVERVDGEVMDACPNLKIIACCRNEAFASIDIEAATERGIPVLSAAGRNAISVAEYTIGILLAVCKNISTTDYLLRHTDKLAGATYADQAKKGETSTSNPPQFWSTDPKGPSALYGGYPEFYGKNFGQIGYGSIGRHVARIAMGFGMTILLNDPFLNPEAVKGLPIRLVDLDTLMKESDFISVNCNVTPDTIGLISKQKIALMKPTAYIVNTARAPIIDYDALVEALEKKAIAGAALDVFPEEPLPKGHPLLALDNVVLTPHIAGQSREIPYHQTETILESLTALLSGERPRTICNPEVLPAWFEKNKALLAKEKTK